MIKYLKTAVKNDLISYMIKNYMKSNMYIASSLVSDKEKIYIEETYKVDLNKILSEFIDAIRVVRINNDILEVYSLDKPIGTTSLNKLIQLLEFGNRNIKQTRCISKLLDKSIESVKEYIGG